MCAGPMTRIDTAFMGFYAVEPEYQGMGIGRDLWAKTIARLDPSTNVGLYGVPGMSSKYKRSGFVLEDSIRMIVYESPKEAGCSVDIECLKDIDDLPGCSLVTINAQTDDPIFERLVEYDQSVQKHSREGLLERYLRGDDAPLTLAIVKDRCAPGSGGSAYAPERKSSCCAKPYQEAIIEDEAMSTMTRRSSFSLLNSGPTNLDPSIPRATLPIDIPAPSAHHMQEASLLTNMEQNAPEIIGYGSIRLDNNSGGIIGPIYADSSDACETILRNLIDRFYLRPGCIYSVMALSSNKNASKILTKIGLKEMDQCSRMFSKFIPSASFSKIFYVHSPNFSLF